MLLSGVYQANYSGGPREVVRFRQEFHKRLDVAVAFARLKAHALKVSPDTGRDHVAAPPALSPSCRTPRRALVACRTGKNPNCQSSICSIPRSPSDRNRRSLSIAVTRNAMSNFSI
jgi:hypothetical protein